MKGLYSTVACSRRQGQYAGVASLRDIVAIRRACEKPSDVSDVSVTPISFQDTSSPMLMVQRNFSLTSSSSVFENGSIRPNLRTDDRTCLEPNIGAGVTSTRRMQSSELSSYILYRVFQSENSETRSLLTNRADTDSPPGTEAGVRCPSWSRSSTGITMCG